MVLPKIKNKLTTIHFSSPPVLLFLTVVCIVIVSITIILEYKARQQDYLLLLSKQSTIFINSVALSTQNAILAAQTIEEEINRKILTNLKLIEKLDQGNQLAKTQLDTILKTTNFKTLLFYDAQGKLLLKSTTDSLFDNILPPAVVQNRLKKQVVTPY